MDQATVLGIVRHVLTSAGGALITHGYITSAGWEDVVGGIIALIGAGWSMYQKSQQKAAVAVAAATGVQP